MKESSGTMEKFCRDEVSRSIEGVMDDVPEMDNAQDKS